MNFFGHHHRHNDKNDNSHGGRQSSPPDSPRSRYGRGDDDHHGHHHHDHGRGRGNPMDCFARKPTYRIYCKAGGDRYSVAVRENKVVLVQSDAHHDTQHWYKDERFGSKAKDEQGHPSFALVNKATGKVMKHSVVREHVTLTHYDPDDGLDLSILWAESDDVGEGFKNIRLVNDIKLCMDAFHGDSDHGGVRDGTHIALYECWNGENQQWKIVPYSNSCQDLMEDPNSVILETPALRKTLEQVIREVAEEQRKGEECHAEAWEMLNSEVIGQQIEEAQNVQEADISNFNEPRKTVSNGMTIFSTSEHQSDPHPPVGPLNLEGLQVGNCSASVDSMVPLEEQVRQRLGKIVGNPMLETRSEGAIFIPQWEITREDCLTDAFSERSITLCHQWCEEIVPPKDHKELLVLGLNELYHWADYHKAQAHIFEMTAREKANTLLLSEQALREAAEKRLSEERSYANQISPKLEITDKLPEEQIETVQKLQKEKANLLGRLHNLEMKCSQQESQLKDQANAFESQLEELKRAAQTSYEEQETRLKYASLSIASLYEDLKERSSQVTILRDKISALEARSAQLLKKKMEIVIKAIMKRHQDLEWVSILDEIDRMDAKLDASL